VGLRRQPFAVRRKLPRVSQRCRRRLTRRTLAIVVFGVCAALPVTATAALSPRLLTGEFGSFSVRPAAIVLSGDGSLVIAGNAAWIGRNPSPHGTASQFGHIEWTAWTATHATGSGVEWLDNCKPNCAQGTYFPQPVELAASRLTDGRYTRLILRFPDGAHTEHLTLEHTGRGPHGYNWG
jgi:hypothetical protein